MAELARALADHFELLAQAGRLQAQRQAQAAAWLDDWVREEYGRAGLARAARLPADAADETIGSPFARMRALHRRLQHIDAAPPSMRPWLRE